jgi:hypothetical protein
MGTIYPLGGVGGEVIPVWGMLKKVLGFEGNKKKGFKYLK